MNRVFLLPRFTVFSNTHILSLIVPFPPVCGIPQLCVNIPCLHQLAKNFQSLGFLDLSYLSLQINMNPFSIKMTFIPVLFLGLKFNEAFELHIFPFKW